MKYIDLFAGVGGFHLGISKAHPDWKCVYSNEWDKYANSVYKKHYKECDDRDIRTVKSSEIPDHDLLCAGFPCQSFSVAGKRLGFNDTRGTMFFEIARILKEKRPRYLLLENVKGLLSHDKGKTFQTILGVLSDLGYRVEWQVLNSKHFGVPQNRERVFIIGHFGGGSGKQVFPLGKNDQRTTETFRREQKKWQGFRSGSLSATIHTRTGSTARGQQLLAVPVLTPDRENKRQNGIRFKTNGEPSFTLTGQDKHGVMVYDDYNSKFRKDNLAGTLTTNTGSKTMRNGQKIVEGIKIRRLTPIECERLQGFPDDYTKYGNDGIEISDTQRYKMMGNAVTTNVVTEIIRCIGER